MFKWWTYPNNVKLYKKLKRVHGKVGGVSPNEDLENNVVDYYIKSGYTGDKVPVYLYPPFKLSLGVSANPIQSKVNKGLDERILKIVPKKTSHKYNDI